MDLFTIRLQLDAESYTIGYVSVDSALRDHGLEALMAAGAVASVWSGDLRVTRDLSGDQLRAQIVGNASTLLRGAA